MGSPPLARGVLIFFAVNINKSRITPACAGSTHSYQVIKLLHWDHPRLRGEYPASFAYQKDLLGSPPLARGVPFLWFSKFSVYRITPACAGSTLNGILNSTPYKDHPRLRGEYKTVV